MNNGAATIVYDGFGNRVAKTVNGVTTKYLVEDDVNPTGYPQVFDELTSGAATRTYTYGLERIDEEQLVENQWTPSFYGYDGFGTVRQLTNSSGTVTDSYEYDAFGNEITHTGTTPNNYLYRGEQYDSDLGLYYLRARYYNPLTGRFMSRDPWDGYVGIPVTLHKYIYAGSNPVSYVDPRGRDLFEYETKSNAAIPEARLIDIYGCIGNAALAAVDIMLDEVEPEDTLGNVGTGLGVGSAVLGCVVLVPGLNELAESGAKTTRETLDLIGQTLGWGACAFGAKDVVVGLDSLLIGKPDAVALRKSLESLGGCVGSALGTMIKAEVPE